MNLHHRVLLSTAFAIATAPFVLAATACGSDHSSEHSAHHSLFDRMTSGSGNVATQTRELPPFDAIDIDGSTDVEVHFGSPQQVSVIGDDNLLDLIDLSVHDGRLVVSSHGSYRSHRDLKVSVQLPALDAIEIEGSGDIALHGVNGGKLKLQIEGSGDIKADGAVDELALRISGSGDAQLRSLSAKRATVEISGSGDASVTATESINAVTNGSGDISYSGDPQRVTVVSHGSGDIHKS
ncbi:MAG: hypothetical protein JWR16_3243 [Nevskia sp.]|nr:hypothetical protein [Nevskia sp.]